MVILGAGISGLVAAYELLKNGSPFEVVIIEQKARAGGWMETDHASGFFFENGPRTFLASRSPALQALCTALGIKFIASDPQGHGRWLWMEGKLHKTPIWSWDFLKALVTEWRVPTKSEDETVWEFATRRFNSTVASHVFDPMCLGIHAGDMKQLSIQACFPLLKEWETKYGSVTRGLLNRKRSKGPYLIGFKEGVSSLVARLQEEIERLGGRFFFQENIQVIEMSEAGVTVQTDKASFEGEACISALPCQVLGKLLVSELLEIPLAGATVVNLGYDQKVLKHAGFGYIVSSQENSDVLGVMFNSNAFPQQNHLEEETRLTVMLRGANFTEKEAVERSLQALKRHLGIEVTPKVAKVVVAKDAFPQMGVGYQAWIKEVEAKLRERFPRLHLVGNYLSGVGVNDCIARAQSISQHIRGSFSARNRADRDRQECGALSDGRKDVSSLIS